MSGWLILAGVALLAAGAIFALGVARELWTFVLAALMLGAAGYALQGHPELPGAPVSAKRDMDEIDQGLSDMRDQMFGRITYERPLLVAADGLSRSGATAQAVQVLLGGIRNEPGSATLWTGLGLAYSEHNEGQVTPAARLAFTKAIELAPSHPGPQFFYGIALLRGGDFEGARAHWTKALALSPQDAEYREGIVERLQLLDRYLQMAAQQQGGMGQ